MSIHPGSGGLTSKQQNWLALYQARLRHIVRTEWLKEPQLINQQSR
jgi:hypothetical protein